jgi:hypothetical protein
MGPNGDQEISMMLLAEIARLKRMVELENKLRNWKPKPNPLQEKIQELEIAKLEAEIEEIRARTEKARADAEKSEATADKLEIETAALASGETHQREMEKIEGQAQGNKELTVTKALVTPTKQGEKKPDVEAAVGYTEVSRGAPRTQSQNSAPVLPQTVDTLPETPELPMLGGMTSPPVTQM